MSLYLNTPKLDSFRLLLPMHELELNPHHHTFLQKVAKVNIHGELIEDFTEQKNYYDPKALISFTYNKANVIMGKKSEWFIKIGISAKALKEDYLQGITAKNLHRIVEQLQHENVIMNATEEMLLRARIYDVDFAIDMHLAEGLTVSDVVSMAYTLTKPKKDITVVKYDRDNNRGIQWGFRNKVGKGYVRKQFLKYYDKVTELQHRSEAFYQKYLQEVRSKAQWQPNKILRNETTLKDPQHFASYGYKSCTRLVDVLGLLEQNIYDFWDRPINYYMSGKKFLPVNLNLMPMDLVVLEKWNDVMLEHKGTRYEDVLEHMLDIFTRDNHDKHHRYNFKKQLLKILAKVKEAEGEAAAKDKGGQYEMMFEQGLTPHHDPNRRRKKNPLRPPASAPVVTPKGNRYIIDKGT